MVTVEVIMFSTFTCLDDCVHMCVCVFVHVCWRVHVMVLWLFPRYPKHKIQGSLVVDKRTQRDQE